MQLMRTVLLKKTVDDGQGCLVGTEFTYTYVTLTRDIAVHRASKALLRQHPSEKRDSWELQPEQLPASCRLDSDSKQEAAA